MVKTKEDVTIELDPESELAKALAVAGKEPVTFVSNGRRYVVRHEPDDPWADYDPEAVREALRAAAGTFTPEEGERLKRDIYRWREEGSRPMNQITASRTADDDAWAMLTPERIRAATRAVDEMLPPEDGARRRAPNEESGQGGRLNGPS